MTYGPFEEDVYIAGMPTFHIAAVTPHTANGAHGYLEMKVTRNGLRLGVRVVMDFRFHEGGRDGQESPGWFPNGPR